MNIAIIGRGELLYNTAVKLIELGYKVPLIITAKEAPEYKRKREDYYRLAQEIGADYFSSANIKTEEILNYLRNQNNLDICISVNYSSIIPAEVINCFKLGILNAHAGDLPRYRGNACVAWAILNKEENVGLCIHKMIGGEVDSGNIIARDYFPLGINSRIGEVYDWMETRIPELMVQSLNLLSKDPNYILEEQSKRPEDSLRTYPRRPEDGRINWNQSNEEVLRLINASSEPFVGAYCFFEDVKCLIWRAELYQTKENYCAINGQVAQVAPSEGIVVTTGSGMLKITEIEMNNERTSPDKFIKSIRKRLS